MTPSYCGQRWPSDSRISPIPWSKRTDCPGRSSSGLTRDLTTTPGSGEDRAPNSSATACAWARVPGPQTKVGVPRCAAVAVWREEPRAPCLRRIGRLGRTVHDGLPHGVKLLRHEQQILADGGFEILYGIQRPAAVTAEQNVDGTPAAARLQADVADVARAVAAAVGHKRAREPRSPHQVCVPHHAHVGAHLGGIRGLFAIERQGRDGDVAHRGLAPPIERFHIDEAELAQAELEVGTE